MTGTFCHDDHRQPKCLAREIGAILFGRGKAAARALGCRELLSEDMSHGREVEGVTINDPFR
jgi:hypothetical protein